MSPELESKIRGVEQGSNGPLVAAGLRISVDAELNQARNEALEEAAKHCDSHGYVVTASEIRAMKK